MCSKHVEAWNKLIVKQKFCASSWLITETNILRCTVSKTSKTEPLSITGHLSILSILIHTILKNCISSPKHFTNLPKKYIYISTPSLFPQLLNFKCMYILHNTYVKCCNLSPSISVYLFSGLWPAWWPYMLKTYRWLELKTCLFWIRWLCLKEFLTYLWIFQNTTRMNC